MYWEKKTGETKYQLNRNLWCHMPCISAQAPTGSSASVAEWDPCHGWIFIGENSEELWFSGGGVCFPWCCSRVQSAPGDASQAPKTGLEKQLATGTEPGAEQATAHQQPVPAYCGKRGYSGSLCRDLSPWPPRGFKPAQIRCAIYPLCLQDRS